MFAAPPSPPAFHVNLGDLPTWLGVVAASGAAVFVYLQLRSQQKETRRQVAALERQQANDVDFIQCGASEILILSNLGAANPVPDTRMALVVANISRRPIRDVRCEVHRRDGRTVQASWVGPCTETEMSFRYQMTNPWMAPAVALIRASHTYGFLIDFDIVQAQSDGATWLTRFTDDAGLSWQIDASLHLQQVAAPAPALPWRGLLPPDPQ